MWYFTWILGIGLALALAIINVMWLEANYAFGQRDEDSTRESFEKEVKAEERR
ncbi:cytochrome bd-I oxidase subunit CydX [Oxalobacteraceae bacterium]|nr:cytochrome bd-I oxidase subunit CydX [Oxalobacteraceae bacterium]